METKKEIRLVLSKDTNVEALEALVNSGGIEILVKSKDPKLNGTPIAVTSIEKVEELDFCRTPQGIALNALHSTIIDKETPGEFDSFTGATVFKNGKLILTLVNREEVGGLRTSTNQLLEALMVKWKANKSNYGVALPLDEYMQLRGLKDKKFARKQIKEDLETLYNLSMKFGNEKEAKPQPPNTIDPVNFETRILAAKGIIKNSIICVSFSPVFTELVKISPTMWLPVLAWRLSAKFELNAHYFLHMFAQQKRMNAGKVNDDIFLAETVLQSSKLIPKYGEVEKSDRAIARRMYEPLEKGLDALDEFLTWEYRNGSEPIGRAEAKRLKYHSYAKLRIIIHWKKEPLSGWRSMLEESEG